MCKKKHSKYKVWYYPQFQATTGGLEHRGMDGEGGTTVPCSFRFFILASPPFL